MNAAWNPADSPHNSLESNLRPAASAEPVAEGMAAFNFAGMPVLVTGGTRGIGHSIATAFRDADAAVTITGTRTEASDYDNDLDGMTYRRCGQDNPGEIAALVAELGSQRQLGALINNAGQTLPGGRDEFDPDVFDQSIHINLTGAYRLTAGCKPLLREWSMQGGTSSGTIPSRTASIVNICSMASLFGVEMVPGYTSAKSALVGMTRALAVAWAGDGIRCNAIAPGLIETDMTAPMLDYAPMADPMLDRTPMRRVGRPDEVAPIALFLCTAQASFITGSMIAVDGGYASKG